MTNPPTSIFSLLLCEKGFHFRCDPFFLLYVCVCVRANGRNTNSVSTLFNEEDETEQLFFV